MSNLSKISPVALNRRAWHPINPKITADDLIQLHKLVFEGKPNEYTVADFTTAYYSAPTPAQRTYHRWLAAQERNERALEQQRRAFTRTEAPQVTVVQEERRSSEEVQEIDWFQMTPEEREGWRERNRARIAGEVEPNNNVINLQALLIARTGTSREIPRSRSTSIIPIITRQHDPYIGDTFSTNPPQRHTIDLQALLAARQETQEQQQRTQEIYRALRETIQTGQHGINFIQENRDSIIDELMPVFSQSNREINLEPELTSRLERIIFNENALYAHDNDDDYTRAV